jgi:hypothetical protein
VIVTHLVLAQPRLGLDAHGGDDKERRGVVVEEREVDDGAVEDGVRVLVLALSADVEHSIPVLVVVVQKSDDAALAVPRVAVHGL